MTFEEELRLRLAGQPDITTVSATTLLMRGQVDRVEEAPGSMGLHIPDRHTFLGFRNKARFYPGQPFSAWFDRPTRGVRLPNQALVFATKNSMAILHAPGWHVGAGPFRSVSTEVVLTSPQTRVVVAVLFSVHKKIRQNISAVYLGAPREAKSSSRGMLLYLQDSKALSSSGLVPVTLPVSLEFLEGSKAYALPDGSAVVLCADKVIFFIV